jgi:hypothetical protein
LISTFYLKKVNDVKVKEQYQVKLSNRYAALQNLDNMWISIRLGKY